jgi:hypothetical protein
MRLMRWFLAPTFAFLVLAGYAGATSHDAAFAMPVRDAHLQPAHHTPLRLSRAHHATRHASARGASSGAHHGARFSVRHAYELAPPMVVLVPLSMRPRPPPAMDCFAT